MKLPKCFTEILAHGLTEIPVIENLTDRCLKMNDLNIFMVFVIGQNQCVIRLCLRHNPQILSF